MKVPRGRCCSSRMEKGFPVSTSMARNIFRRSSRIGGGMRVTRRSEEHTSELQSQSNLVCRLLLEKKKKSADIALLEKTLAVIQLHYTGVVQCTEHLQRFTLEGQRVATPYRPKSPIARRRAALRCL